MTSSKPNTYVEYHREIDNDAGILHRKKDSIRRLGVEKLVAKMDFSNNCPVV